MTKKEKPLSETAVIYARYSSHNQNDASIEQQVAACTRYAKARGLRVIEIYADRAISGKTDRRRELQRMLADASRGGFGYVIAWKSSRIGRNIQEALAIDDRLNQAGIHTLYCEEDFGDSAAGRFALRNMMNLNQFYSDSLREDVLRGLNANAEKCLSNGRLPYGYTADKEKNILIVPEQAAIVHEVFQRYAANEPKHAIIDDLNRRRIPNLHGGKWSHQTLLNLLRNERYTGVYMYGSIRIEGGMPTILCRHAPNLIPCTAIRNGIF